MDKKSKRNKVINTIMSYVLVILVAIIIKSFIFTPIRVNGTSMVPTLNDSDIMVLNEIGYHINGVKRFDIVVANINGEKLIKRVIGLPGEKVEYRDNNLYINDEMVMETFKHADTPDFSIESLGSGVVPNNHYFLVGDNRINSNDSRYIGFVSANKILGKTNMVIFPFSRIGSVQ